MLIAYENFTNASVIYNDETIGLFKLNLYYKLNPEQSPEEYFNYVKDVGQRNISLIQRMHFYAIINKKVVIKS